MKKIKATKKTVVPNPNMPNVKPSGNHPTQQPEPPRVRKPAAKDVNHGGSHTTSEPRDLKMIGSNHIERDAEKIKIFRHRSEGGSSGNATLVPHPKMSSRDWNSENINTPNTEEK